eukprot:166970_1
MAVNLNSYSNTNTSAKADGNMSTKKNNNIDAELFIAKKHHSLNTNTVEPSTIIKHLIVTKTKLSKYEFCTEMKQQCNIKMNDAIKLWKKYNQKLQPEGYSNDKNNIITN